MSEEIIKEETQAAAEPAKKRMKKGPIIAGVVVIVIAALAISLSVWHNQPSFCATICHDAMADFVDNYNGTDESEGAGLASIHRMVGLDCLDCHKTDTATQMAELEAYRSGDYPMPLFGSNNFYYEDEATCLSCHGETRDGLAEKTQALGAYNPHDNLHGQLSCNECHKGHAPQEDRCQMCHIAPDMRMFN